MRSAPVRDRLLDAARPLWLLLLVAGCPVDDREFIPLDEVVTGGTAPAGGTRSTGGTGGSPPVSSGGTVASAGAGGEREPWICPDLDENGVGDCDETLVRNANFSRGIELWKPEPNILIQGEAHDASENSPPSSMSVASVLERASDALVTAGASQCVVLPGGGDYTFFAQVYLPPDQGEGSAGISGLFFDNESCVGPATGTFMSMFVKDTDEWVSIGGTWPAPETALSVSIRLLTTKPFRQPELQALFDDILVRAE
jgi:hypothetical protein